MEDMMKVQISEDVAIKVFHKLQNLKLIYQQKSGQASKPERGQRWLEKAKEVDDLMTVIAMAMDEAEEAEA